MKKIIVCLTLAAFATMSLQAGENCAEKTACAVKAQTASCASQKVSACSKGAKTAKKASQVKGAQLLAQR